MKQNDIIHGFRVDSVRNLPQIKATIYQFTHLKTLAKTIWLDREDENKTFAIAFKTTPTDDTGVFHILEHSVLNGSLKYPVKEPFVDLLKGSLQTFLNAMTYPDKTVFPVSSRNDKDFKNLMSIYLDAVFNPLCLENEFIFAQEGWRYDIEEQRQPIEYKGVVYSEMKGAFANAERLAGHTLMQQLFPDNCYGRNSGGNPQFIPDLSYEEFVQAHHKYYSATNSYIYLDGSLDIDDALKFIDDEYLSKQEKVCDLVEIQPQAPVVNEKYVQEYATSEEDISNKTYINFGYVISDYSDYEKVTAMSLISSTLTSSNQSPLKKEIISRQLAEDIDTYVEDGVYQPYFAIDVSNSEADKYEQIEQVISEVLRKIVKEGLDKEELTASLNKLEFIYKERDFGGAPKGLVYGLSALNTWLYGGDPVDGFIMDDIFAKMRQYINTNYFENLLEQVVLNSKHHASVITVPNKDLDNKRKKAVERKLNEYKQSLSQQQLEELVEKNNQFRQWQVREDSAEAKASIPMLQLSDISSKVREIKKDISEIDGVKLLSYSENSEGINYVNLYFDINDLQLEDLSLVSLMCDLLDEVPTKKRSVLQLNKDKKMYLGKFSLSPIVSTNNDNNYGDARIVVSFSFLNQNKQQALDLVLDILQNCCFNQYQEILDHLKQAKMMAQQAINANGVTFGVNRCLASLCQSGVIEEYLSGYTCYNYLKNLIDKYSGETLTKMQSMYDKLFTKERLTISLMGDDQEMIANKLVANIQSTGVLEKTSDKPLLPRVNEGIEIASQVCYCIKGSDAIVKYKDLRGKLLVINKIVTLDYFWNNIRVKNGAYGCGLTRKFSCLVAYSYRDPDGVDSLRTYNDTTKYLEDFVNSDEDLTKYIIGTLGDTDPLLTNSTLMRAGDDEYFSKLSYEKKCEIISQIINLDKQQIKELIDLYRLDDANSALCVVGSLQQLERFDHLQVLHL